MGNILTWFQHITLNRISHKMSKTFCPGQRQTVTSSPLWEQCSCCPCTYVGVSGLSKFVNTVNISRAMYVVHITFLSVMYFNTKTSCLHTIHGYCCTGGRVKYTTSATCAASVAAEGCCRCRDVVPIPVPLQQQRSAFYHPEIPNVLLSHPTVDAAVFGPNNPCVIEQLM